MRSKVNVMGEKQAAALAAAMVHQSMWFEVEPQFNDVFLFTFKNENCEWVHQWLSDYEDVVGRG